MLIFFEAHANICLNNFVFSFNVKIEYHLSIRNIDIKFIIIDNIYQIHKRAKKNSENISYRVEHSINWNIWSR